MKTRLSRFLAGVISYTAIGVFYVYVIGAVLGAVYFNYRVFKDDGFMAWLVLGEVVGTLKGAVWPYYLYKHIYQGEEEEGENSLWAPMKGSESCFQLGPNEIAKLKMMEVIREDENFSSKIYSDGTGKYYPVFNDKKTCEVMTRAVEREYLKRKGYQ